MKVLIIVLSVASFFYSYEVETVVKTETKIERSIGSSFSLINDTKEKINIHTGSGFVTLNKGSKTSISCKAGKEVRWANKGKKGDVIFKIKNDMCGKTIKLSKLID